MRAATAKAAKQFLDEVYRLTQLEAFDEPGYLEALAAEVAEVDDGTPAGLVARDAELDAALASIDALTSRAMKIRLDHALHDIPSVEPPFLMYLTVRVTDYADDLEPLRARVRGVVARSDSAGAAEAADIVCAAADSVLALRRRLRDGVAALRRVVEEPEDQEPEREVDRFELLELD